MSCPVGSTRTRSEPRRRQHPEASPRANRRCARRAEMPLKDRRFPSRGKTLAFEARPIQNGKVTGTSEQRRLEILAAVDEIADAAFSLEPGGPSDRTEPHEAIGSVLDLIVPDVVDLAIVAAPDSEAGGDHVFVRATGSRG